MGEVGGSFNERKNEITRKSRMCPAKYNIEYENARAKLASLGSVLGVKNDADEIVAMMSNWLRRLKLPSDLKSFQIDSNDLKKIEKYALADPSCPTNSRKVVAGDVIDILERLI